jgi:uncharacterized membrane protein YphA (DoxX/SURF4 family)
LSFAFQKLQGNYLSSGASLGRQLEQGLANSQDFYQSFLSSVVIPNVDLFARLVVLGESFVALTMILGLLTRAGGMVGIVLNLNYMLMKGLANSAGSVDRLFVLTELVMIVAAAGQVWGLDGALAPRLARIPAIGWLSGADRASANGRRLRPGYGTN